MCVCSFVLYKNPNRWMDCDEISKEVGPKGPEGQQQAISKYLSLII